MIQADFEIIYERGKGRFRVVRSADRYALDVCVKYTGTLHSDADLPTLKVFDERVQDAFTFHRGVVMIQDEGLLCSELVALTNDVSKLHQVDTASLFVDNLIEMKFGVARETAEIQSAVQAGHDGDIRPLLDLFKAVVRQSAYPKFHWWTQFIPF